MTVPKAIHELVDRFHRNIEAYRSSSYKEAQVRLEFINPMFKELGWDIDNTDGYAEAYKDVVHEDTIKIGGATKAPDYCFRIGGTRKFFLEAKKPSVSIKDDVHPAYQLRRYAWSAKLPLSILTDFEEFAVFDCRVKPSPADKASVARTFMFEYTEYADRWDEIAGIFSRDAVLRGSFDKYVESAKRKKGTAEVDTAFLKEIESWRDVLARNIALRNPNLTQRELNFAIQRTIDRLIFLRICEDRGIESYQRLMAQTSGTRVYQRLCQMFRQADDRYNSGLFHFRDERGRTEPPDDLTLHLTIDDKVLKDIVKNLYYPDSPYEFSVLPADILGQVYEQFLGKVIRLTKGHRAVVEDKPEVKKAGGVYYTPTYIVDYIVENTVGKLVEGKTPRQITGARNRPPLRVLDPACGSGSFLIGTYQYLLNWYRDWYSNNDPEKWMRGKNPPIYLHGYHGTHREGERTREPKSMSGTNGGSRVRSPSRRSPSQYDYRLTTAERKRILLTHIYGVDIDTQAVEVTKLSLLLKVLEGENEETVNQQLALFHERALPDLSNNIKCGNSLIGPDFYDGQQMTLLDDEERYRINVFDWNAEFPEVFSGRNAGFDAVIGNPPYIRVRFFRSIYPEQVEYLSSRYHCATHVWDIYLLFFERALELSREGGRFSFIVPVQTLHQPNCEALRRLLLADSSLLIVADLSRLRVFQKAIVKNCILVCEKGARPDAKIAVYIPDVADELLGPPAREWPQEAALHNPGCSIKVDLLSFKRDLCEKLQLRSRLLNELCYVTFGLRSCAKGRGQGGKGRLIVEDRSLPDAKPYLEGRDIERYAMYPKGHYLRYIPEEMYSPRSPLLFETKKIVSQSMLSRKRLIATLDTFGYYVEQSLVCIIPHGILTEKSSAPDIPLEFILGILDSRVQNFYFGAYIIDCSLGGGLIHATPGSQGKLLVPRASEKDMSAIISLVVRMLDLHKQLVMVKTVHDKTVLQRQIDATERQIDRLVYELYELTDEEIAIVEEGT